MLASCSQPDCPPPVFDINDYDPADKLSLVCESDPACEDAAWQQYTEDWFKAWTWAVNAERFLEYNYNLAMAGCEGDLSCEKQTRCTFKQDIDKVRSDFEEDANRILNEYVAALYECCEEELYAMQQVDCPFPGFNFCEFPKPPGPKPGIICQDGLPPSQACVDTLWSEYALQSRALFDIFCRKNIAMYQDYLDDAADCSECLNDIRCEYQEKFDVMKEDYARKLDDLTNDFFESALQCC